MSHGRNWTEALRFPLVLGKLGRWTMPFTLALTQLAAFIGSFVALLVTRSAWGAFLPGIARLTILIAVPSTLAWATRYLRLEGRGLAGILVGYGSYYLSPKRGIYKGRPYRQPRGQAHHARGERRHRLAFRSAA